MSPRNLPGRLRGLFFVDKFISYLFSYSDLSLQLALAEEVLVELALAEEVLVELALAEEVLVELALAEEVLVGAISGPRLHGIQAN
jgi:hypothetical protein